MNSYLSSAIKQFQNYKDQAERTFDQLSDEELIWQANPESNSIAMIVQHMAGNMLSRWTNFMTEDGEKTWRQREAEFELVLKTRPEIIKQWELGWDCFFKALQSLKIEDLEKTIFIRNQRHTVVEAINRQLTHYPSHVGQIMFIGKMLKGKDWQSLSIAKGATAAFNKEKFSREN